MVSTNGNLDFEKINFNPFKTIETLLDKFSDSELTLFNENMLNLDTSYFIPEEASQYLTNVDSKSLSILHVNIRSLKKNFENFKLLLSNLSFCFKIICLTETWSKDQNMTQNSLFNLPNYAAIHQDRRNNKRGGGVCTYIHNSVTFKVRHDLSLCGNDSESLCVELINKKSKNVIINTIYRPPAGKIKQFKNHLKICS